VKKKKTNEKATYWGVALYLCNYVHSPLDTQAESFAVAYRDTKHNFPPGPQPRVISIHTSRQTHTWNLET